MGRLSRSPCIIQGSEPSHQRDEAAGAFYINCSQWLLKGCSWGCSFPGAPPGSAGYYGQDTDSAAGETDSCRHRHGKTQGHVGLDLTGFCSICWQHVFSWKWLESLKYSFQLWYSLCAESTLEILNRLSSNVNSNATIITSKAIQSWFRSASKWTTVKNFGRHFVANAQWA